MSLPSEVTESFDTLYQWHRQIMEQDSYDKQPINEKITQENLCDQLKNSPEVDNAHFPRELSHWILENS